MDEGDPNSSAQIGLLLAFPGTLYDGDGPAVTLETTELLRPAA